MIEESKHRHSNTRPVRCFLLLAGVLFIRPAAAGIQREFSSSRHGWVSIFVTGAKALSMHPELDPLQLGFFLLSDEALFEAISLEPPLPLDLYHNQEWLSPNCVLYSPYITTLFTFADLDDEGHFNRTFTVTHTDEYNLLFASCTLEAMEVTMEIHA
ncbi:hypothetical protein SETIT_8G218400v2 [Setaria italica]|uniref:CAND6/7 N-terminal domain-containing protein n=1 Tax=Setaria italica TaxID=4555 RepID=A0A368SAI0_SETIT|nr:hypothetical protein SETIT_8G218400v2 [Setaria italica]